MAPVRLCELECKIGIVTLTIAGLQSSAAGSVFTVDMSMLRPPLAAEAYRDMRHTRTPSQLACPHAPQTQQTPQSLARKPFLQPPARPPYGRGTFID